MVEGFGEEKTLLGVYGERNDKDLGKSCKEVPKRDVKISIQKSIREPRPLLEQ